MHYWQFFDTVEQWQDAYDAYDRIQDAKKAQEERTTLKSENDVAWRPTSAIR